MTRLIDAEEIKRRIERMHSFNWCDEDYDPIEFLWDKPLLLKLIDKSPTIDAVEVVWCGECKYFNGVYCIKFPKLVSGADYCSYGERIKT